MDLFHQELTCSIWPNVLLLRYNFRSATEFRKSLFLSTRVKLLLEYLLSKQMVTEPWHDPLHCARYALQICSHKLQSTFVLQFLLLNTKYVVSLLGLAGETTTTVRSCCNIGDLRGWWRFVSMQVVKNSHSIILGPTIPRSTSKLYVFFLFY